jgi:sugar O-acyltransferase (sialic acid O-acetyltransferase NeuD family)
MDIISDIVEEVYFEIYPNLITIEEPNIPYQKEFYNYTIITPNTYNHLFGNEFTFGVTGPNAKESIFKYFLQYGIDKCKYMNWIHPMAYISRSARLEKGIIIEPNVTVSSHATIGFGVTVKRNASIGHHSIIDDYTEINPGVHIMGHVNIGKKTIIGAGSTIRDGITIGSNVTVGMGSNVVKDIPDNVIALGNPCTIWKEK